MFKVLEINGKSLLERVVDRCKNANLDLPIIIATSTRLIDDQIENFSNNNLLIRYIYSFLLGNININTIQKERLPTKAINYPVFRLDLTKLFEPILKY